MGMTLNFMIMFAMLLAVGILVDGPIIVVEYADRKMTEGAPPKAAFAEAARRMFWPVVSATATMIGAFIPMLFWPDVVGKFMSYFPITLIIVLSASMFVALIFVPVLGGMLGKKPPPDAAHEAAIEASETGDWREIPGITGWYAHLSERIAQHPGRVILGALGVVTLIILVYFRWNNGTEFFVDSDPTYANVLISARGNLSANEKRDIVMGVARIVQSVDGLKFVYATSGGQQDTLNDQGGVPVDNIGEIEIEMKDYHERRRGTVILEEIRQKTADLAGVHVEVRVPTNGPPTGKDVMIDVSSDDHAALVQTTDTIRRHMDGLKELRDLEDTRPLPGIEWDLDIDRDVANRFGANAQTIGTAVQLVTDGILVGEYRPDDTTQQVDIRVRYPAASRGIHALDDVRVSTPGGMVPISNFVKLRPAPQVNSIERVDGHRVYHIRANLKPGVLPAAEVAKLKAWMATQTFSSSVHVAFKGADEQQNKSFLFLVGAAFGALFLIAMVLVAMFNSFYHATLILIAVVLAMIGALLGMLIMGQPFSVIMSGTGMLALAGIVVNHNIVLIDTFRRLRLTGMDPIEAVIRSSAQRLRPVFLTTVTAIGGLLPMMFAIETDFWTRQVTIGGPDGMIWVPMSTAIVFGLAFSKMITLGLVPAMLALPYRIREARALRRARHSGANDVSTVARPRPLPQPEAQAAE